MVKRNELLDFLDSYLHSNEIDDASLNGLQVEGKEEIQRIVLGVSANYSLFKKAASLKADAIIVHHGLFWKGMNFRMTGILKDRIEILLKNKINLFAYHLPLDRHEEAGNNITLLNTLNAENTVPFGYYHGVPIGYQGNLKQPLLLEDIREKLEKELEQPAVKLYDFGEKKINSVAAVSGGASSLIHEAIARNVDLFITGELTEYTQELCREAKLNYMALGHYASEKTGIKELGKIINKRFTCEMEFIDIRNDF